jgi:tRNA G18 (ribose-2'-O)-methylase SpoU
MHHLIIAKSNARSQVVPRCDARVATRTVRSVVIEIDDPLDLRLVEYRGLRERGKESDEYFIVEGLTAIQRLLTSPYPVRSVLLTSATLARLGEQPDGATIYVLSTEAMTSVAGVNLHRGAVASATRLASPALADVLPTARRLVMLEGINDHENLGAIARTARGLGADALLLDPTCADPFYRRSVRVSMGELLHLPIVRSDDWAGVFEQVAATGFEIWALTPCVDATDIFTMVTPSRWALVVGAEGPGLRDETLARCTSVRIPMRNGVDSLNVGHAVAAALAR